MAHLKRISLCSEFFMQKNKHLKLIQDTIQAIYFCHEKKFSIGKKICMENIFSNVKFHSIRFEKKNNFNFSE